MLSLAALLQDRWEAQGRSQGGLTLRAGAWREAGGPQLAEKLAAHRKPFTEEAAPGGSNLEKVGWRETPYNLVRQMAT